MLKIVNCEVKDVTSGKPPNVNIFVKSLIKCSSLPYQMNIL